MHADLRLSADIAVELYVHSDVVSGEFPRIEIQPVVWNFYLVSIHDFLLEYAVPVS